MLGGLGLLWPEKPLSEIVQPLSVSHVLPLCRVWRQKHHVCYLFSLHLILSLIFQTRSRGWRACGIAELISGKPEKNRLPLNPQALIVIHILNQWPSHDVEFLSTDCNTPSCICMTPATVWISFWFFQTHFGTHSTKLPRYLGDLGPIGVFNMSQPLYAILGT